MTETAKIDGETARKLQITAIVEMFAGLGAEATDERVAYYLRLLGRIPPFLMRAACDRAVLDSPNGFPPGPGEIMRAAEAIHAERAKQQRKQLAQRQWTDYERSIGSGRTQE